MLVYSQLQYVSPAGRHTRHMCKHFLGFYSMWQYKVHTVSSVTLKDKVCILYIMPLWQNMYVAIIYIHILFKQEFTVSLSITNSVLKIYITDFHYCNSSTSDSSCFTLACFAFYSTCGTNPQLLFIISYHHTVWL
jgi:hypothetical protein